MIGHVVNILETDVGTKLAGTRLVINPDGGGTP